MKVSAKLVALTQPTLQVPAATSEEFVAFAARVSSERNYEDRAKDYDKLLKYCLKNKHFSVFEMSNAVVEVEAPRDITRQLLRHRSFSFQEFSQRYSDEIEFTEREFRRQDTKNRQNSVDDLHKSLQDKFENITETLAFEAQQLYTNMRQHSVAKECARVILPEGLTMSRLYVNGTLRSWLHYLEVRDDPGVTQWEHVLLARKIKDVLLPAFPTVFGLLEEPNVPGTEYYNDEKG